MTLYISIVELAEMAALRGGDVHIQETALLELVWGTAVGLSLAHWFAFGVVARGVGGGRIGRQDARIGVAQVAAAGAVSLLCSVPIVLSDGNLRAAAVVPAVFIGASGYWAARAAGRARGPALVAAAVVLASGLVVALVKSNLIGH